MIGIAVLLMAGCCMGGAASDASGHSLENAAAADGSSSEEYQAQRQETIEYLKQGIRGHGYSGDQAAAYIRQGYVEGLLSLEELVGEVPSCPHLLNVFLIDKDPVHFRFVMLTWIGQSNAIPSFEVIGDGGRVVGAFEGIADYEEPIGGYPDTWIRTLPFRPILKGDAVVNKPETDSPYPTIELSVASLQQVDGARLTLHHDCCNRFVRGFMGAGVGTVEDERGAEGEDNPVPANEVDIWQRPELNRMQEWPFPDPERVAEEKDLK